MFILFYNMLQNEALEILKMGYNVFLTGEAGTGKTYVLHKYIEFLKKKNISIAVTASTGVAATHLDGVTIDSWSGLGIRNELTDKDLNELAHKFHLRKRLLDTKVLVIDEISMIHGGRFDLIDKILRFIRNSQSPFGGIQVILSGDLFQLPPVSNNRKDIDFIFKSRAWCKLNLKICYLHEPKRHKKGDLLSILTDIRQARVTDNTRNLLLSSREKKVANSFSPTKLYTHNVDVDEINRQELDKISSDNHQFFMTVLGPEKLTLQMKRSCLAPEVLDLKRGALVMFVRNNFEQGYVNGTLGKVTGFTKIYDPVVETLAHKKITVSQAVWTIEEDRKIIAQLTQIPLRLAWAITVHKSQGMTLDAAEIDLSRSFVEGMGYVALSRVKSLTGLRLLGINEMALKVNPQISAFDDELLYLSRQFELEIKKMGLLGRWFKKRKFMYYLTS